jgi:predicted lipoprotein
MSILGLHEHKRRLLIPAAGVVVAAFFFLGFQPLARRAESLDAPLAADWKRLAIAVGESNATTLDFEGIAAALRRTRESLAVVEAARQQASARVQVGPELRERLNTAFQLVDFQNEVQRLIAELEQRARQANVTLDPAVALGFPEHTMEVRQPELLWAELAFVNDLLTLAIQSRVSAIQSVGLPAAPTNRPAANGPGRLVEIPVQLELSGPMPAVTRFLESLPLRASEFEEAGLPTAPTNKPALFIEHFLLRKEAPEKPDQVHLSLRAAGFVFRE